MAMNFRRREPEEPEINLIPFIDVLLVVLIFLMLSTTYSKFTELQVTLPTADAEKPRDNPHEIIVAIAADGRYAINRKPVDGRSVDLLAAQLSAASDGSKDAMVIISADANAVHQSVINVMDAARRVGLVRLTFATQASGSGDAREPAGRMLAALARRIEGAWSVRGPLAWLLYPLSLAYRFVLALRGTAACAGWPRVQRLPVPMIVVGNLVAGGAGKTPAVLAVLELLRREGWTPGVVSRGYGRKGGGVLEVLRSTPVQLCGDEPLLLHLRGRAPVVVGRDRPAAARALLAAHSRVDIIVSDDGLQHRRLGRDAQLIVFDERGAGNGWLLPAGPLREPLAHEVPAHSVVLYNAPCATTAWPGEVARRGIGGAALLAAWRAGEPTIEANLTALRGRRVLAAAGIARPQRFFAMLRERGLTIDEMALPDHFDFENLPWPAPTPDVIVTEKDAIKLTADMPLEGTRIWVATLDFQLAAATEAALLGLLPRRPQNVQ
ncbi:MAG: tetraacyldisaccharide 4'-kinase [Burkholderiales bacterium]